MMWTDAGCGPARAFMIRGGYASKRGGGNRLGNVRFLQAEFEQKLK